MAYENLAEHYDRLMQDMPYEVWTDWTKEMWQKTWGRMPDHAIELGCGTGNITIPLAVSGVGMTGVDLSENMLAIAQMKWENKRNEKPLAGTAIFQCQDMVSLQTAAPVDSVLAYCDTFNYLTDEQAFISALRSACRALKEGGLLLFDMLPQARYEAYAAQQPFVNDEGDLAYHWFCEYDASLNVMTHDLTFFIAEGNFYRKYNEIHTQRAYDPEWVLKQLEAVGFSKASYRTGLFNDHHILADRIFFIAEK